MYAVIEINGNQVVVEKDSCFTVNRVKGLYDKKLEINTVLFGKKGNKHYIGDPYIKDAKVECEVLSEKRGKKVISYKYRDRKSSQSKRGHRQDLTELKVTSIEFGKEEN